MSNMKSIVKPEALLANFNNSLSKTMRSIRFLNNTELEACGKSIMRKSIIAQLLFDKNIIAVSGMQGTGKTTLIKNFYEIPEGILPETISRGEKMPIIITEHNNNNYSFLVTKFISSDKDSFEVCSEVLEEEKFANRGRNPERDDLYLELKVPYRYFHNNLSGFMLLPGIEYRGSEWSDLAAFGLYFASACIFVLTESKMADKTNSEILEKITAEFDVSKPVYVLSFSDQSKDSNRVLKDTFLKEFKIPLSEKDRVIRAGTTKELLKEWIPEIKNALNKYGLFNASFRKTQLDNLECLLRDDVGAFISKTDDELNYSSVKQDNNATDYIDPIIETAQKEIERIRKIYSKNMRDTLDAFTVKPIDELRGKIVEKGFFSKLKGMFVSESLKEKIEFENQIRSAWETANGYSDEFVYIHVLNRIMSQELKVLDGKTLYPQLASSGTNAKELTGYTEEADNRFGQIFSAEVQQNMLAVLHHDSKKTTQPHLETNKQLLNSVKLMPVLALELSRFQALYPNTFVVNNEGAMILSPQENMSNILNHFEFMTSSSGKIATALGAFLGIDVIKDGSLDSIPMLLKAMGLSTATVAGKFVLGTMGVAGAGILSAAVISQLNRLDIRKADYATGIIINLKDRVYSRYMDVFDEIMGNLIYYIQEKLNVRYSMGDSFFKREKCMKALSDLKVIQTDVRELTYDSKRALV